MRIWQVGIIVGCLFLAVRAFGADDGPTPGPVSGGQASQARTKADNRAPQTEEAKLLAAVREALERNARELNALKEQYARDMQTQRQKAEVQQKQIDTLQQMTRTLEGQLKAGNAAPPAGAAPEAGAQTTGPQADRQRRLSDVQQRQLRLLEDQVGLVSQAVDQQASKVDDLATQGATLESRTKQAAARDRQLGEAVDSLRDNVDSLRRNYPMLPAPLKELFTPSGNNVTPISIWNTVSTRYEVFQGQRGAGEFQFQEYTPFFLVQLNKRMLLSAETTFTQSGVGLGQAQLDMFINNWLTMDVGYFLAPIGFWNERLDPRWINKLPDIPLVMRQVIPDGLTVTGIQFRGAKYLFGSPFKMEYAAFASNGLGVPGAGKAADWADQGGLIGSTANVNQSMAYGGRLAIWLPSRGINFGASELVSAPYGVGSGPIYNIWQPYFNYHYGNWDFRFEYGDAYQNVRAFTGNNIRRQGMYAQLAYRNYASLRQHLQRLEYVFRFSDAFFHGIDTSKLDLTSYSPVMNAPIDMNQYTIGI
ncbi:MAG: hypothetical protein ACYC0H_20205, partial [Solirubrobacteraceae bacterium]